jgi:hypothetical protein
MGAQEKGRFRQGTFINYLKKKKIAALCQISTIQQSNGLGVHYHANAK